MTIGEQVAAMVARRVPRIPNPDGGIGGLTPAEDQALSDLLNPPGSTCECGDEGCCSPLSRNPDRGPGR